MGFAHLAALTTAMAAATLFASFLPLWISLSPKAVTRTSTYGACHMSSVYSLLSDQMSPNGVGIETRS